MKVKLDKERKLLVDYINLHGHCRVSVSDKKNKVLYNFLKKIPQLYSENKLSSKLAAILMRGGYDFKNVRNKTIKTCSIDNMAINICRSESEIKKTERLIYIIDALKEYYKRYGDYDVPFNWKENVKFGRQVYYVRYLFRNDKLPVKIKEMLDEINFDFDPGMTKFMIFIQKLKSYYKRFQDYDVPYGWEEDPEFSWQVCHVRQQGRRGKLLLYKVEELTKMGFSFELSINSRKISNTINKMIAELTVFKKENGHCNVPYNYEKNPALGRYVSYIRIRKKRGRLLYSQEKELEGMGFIFELRKKARNLDEGFGKTKKMLIKFKAANGHLKITSRDKNDKKLYYRVINLRRWIKGGLVDKDKLNELEGIGFDFAFLKKPKQRRFSELLDSTIVELIKFKKENGHCNVPYKCENPPSLGRHVAYIRVMKKKGKLTRGQEKRLEKIGFKFELMKRAKNISERIKITIDELLVFKKENGHFCIPINYKKNPKLAWRVSKLRLWKKQGKLSKEDEKACEKIGFDFAPNKTKFLNFIDKLKLYYLRFRNYNVPYAWPEDPKFGKRACIIRNLDKKGKLPLYQKEILKEHEISF